MAKSPSEILNRQVIQNFRTSGDSQHVQTVLPESAASGEIIVQLADPASGTSLWTLAKDGITPVQFVNKETVESMIASGAVIEVDKIEESVGLKSDGSLPDDWKFTNKNIVQALEGLSGDVVTTINEVSGAVKTTIEAMDKSADAQVGKIVTTVSETDGVVSETKAFLKDIVLNGYTKSNSIGPIDDDDTVNEALSKLENQIGLNAITNADGSINVTTGANSTDINVNIKSGEHVLAKDGNGGIYTDIDLVKITTGLPETIKERYQLLATDDSQIGINIDVPKDSHIVSITYISDPSDAHYQNLEYVYIDVEGEEQTTYVDMSELVIEEEFKSGVTVTNHIVHGVVDSTSEKDSQATPVDFLTVGADGFKVSGIKDEIDRKINALDAGVSGTSSDNHVEVRIAEADGKLTSVEVIGTDIASAQALSDEIAARKAVDGQTGQTYEANSSAKYINTATSLNNADVILDEIIGEVTGLTSGNTRFSSTETVAKSISDIKADIQAFKNKLTLSAVDDKYISTQITTADTGTTIGISAITAVISASTSNNSALADSYDVRTFAVSAVDNTSLATSAGVQVKSLGNDKVLDFTNLKVDCGEF